MSFNYIRIKRNLLRDINNAVRHAKFVEDEGESLTIEGKDILYENKNYYYVLNNNRMVDFYINKEDDHPIFTKLLNHLSVEVLQTIYDDADGMSLFDDCGRDCGCKQQEGV